MWRAVQPRLSAESGFWKTIWIERLSSVGRSVDSGASACSSSSRLEPGSGRSMPRIVLASVDLPDPDSPTRPERLAVEQLEVDLDQRRDVVPALVERLGHVRRRQHLLAVDGVLADDRRRFDDLAQPVAVVAARPAARGDLDDRRLHRPAQLVGERAAVDEDAGRQVRPDLRAGCPGSSTGRAATCGCRGAAATAGGPSVYGCSGCSKTAAASPSSTILPAYITPTRSHIVRMTPRLWAISRTAALVSAWSDADEVEHARLDRGVEPGRRLVEDEQLRVGRQRDGDDDALLHAARQLVRVALGDAAPDRRSGRACSALSALAFACGLALAEDA